MEIQEHTESPPKAYHKHQSFESFFSNINASCEHQTQRAIRVLQQALAEEMVSSHKAGVVQRLLDDLRSPSETSPFRLTQFIADEMSRLSDGELLRYLYHRYRYDVFPRQKELDQYPPYLQIEPSSLCNFKCVFCYQTDAVFTAKSSGFMGRMEFSLFRDVIDQAESHVELGSLSSRGEPLLCPDIDKMLAYTSGKFVGLKLNTNASRLTEERCHSILSSGLAVVVFSIDAADAKTYEQYRVGGSFPKTLGNIRLFQSIRQRHYPQSRLITRVSGVKYDETKQDMETMRSMWSNLVDQVAFVRYNPWENIYEKAANGMTEPCSDLWRRMFVWFDGKVNPCDTDYRSTLAIGNIREGTLSSLWRSPLYEALRQRHISGHRQSQEPCKRCSVL